jgi:FAD/FMN-containing dehydrogenase
MMWGPLDRNRIIYELQVTEGRIREIDFRIMELKRHRASILGKFFFTDFDRTEIARIDARIAELEYMREELKRRANHLRQLLSRY